MRIVGVLVVHVAGVVVFAAAGVGPNTTPVKVILEIAMGGRAFWAWANARGQSAEGETPASVHLSLLEEVGSVGAGTGKLGVPLGVPAGSTTLLGEPFFRNKEFSRDEVMVPW
jgi:hypothetical protein